MIKFEGNKEQYLINYIFKKRYLFINHKIDNRLRKNFYKKYFINNKTNLSVLDIQRQISQIIKVHHLLVKLKKNKKPIFFFGINEYRASKLDKSSVDNILFINNKIFNLCFSNKKDDFFSKAINNFFFMIYDNKFLLNDNKNFLLSLKTFQNFLLYINRKKETVINGFYFDNWEGGSFSNHNTLKFNLDKNPINQLFVDTNFIRKIPLDYLLVFVRRFRTLWMLSYFFDNYNQTPGAVVMFSSKGYYDHFFKEFKALGVPIICISNKTEVLKQVDYPLLGDDSNLNIISFYLKIIKNALK